MNGRVQAICISLCAGGTMERVTEVAALAGIGLVGDRYAAGQGSYNKGKQGTRQVTLIHGIFFEGSGFTYEESRRNIVTDGVELMWLIGREFRIGEAVFRGEKYCDPCQRPSKLAGKTTSFQEKFFDRGGLVAAVLSDGMIRVGDSIVPPAKGY